MAWTNVHTSPSSQTTNVTQNWGTYRAMSGVVQMRLTDVSTDYTWVTAHVDVWLMDSKGNTWGHKLLSKSWGVIPGFVTVATITPKTSLHLATRIQLYHNVQGVLGWDAGHAGVTFESDIRWDNTGSTGSMG